MVKPSPAACPIWGRLRQFMPFYRHRGNIQSIDSRYLQWVLKMPDLNHDLRQYIKDELTGRQQQTQYRRDYR